MKTILTLTLIIGAASAGCIALAQPVSDVPANHWAAQSVNRLAAKHIMSKTPAGKFDGNKPVTRYELAVTLDRLVRYMETGHKPLNPSPKRSALVLPTAADAQTRQALAYLAQGGYISAGSPLLQGNKVVTAQELTAVLSPIVIRLSDRSLPPNTQ